MPGGNLIVTSTPMPTPAGTIVVGPLTITVASPLGVAVDLTYTGLQTIGVNVPTGATAVVIVPPPANTIELVLIGAPTDIGVPLSASNPSLVSLWPATPSFYLRSEAAIPAGPVQCLFV